MIVKKINKIKNNQDLDKIDIYAEYKSDDEYKNRLLNNKVLIKEKIPKALEDIILCLEECNKLGNFVDYQMYEDLLETVCKQLMINDKMTESLYNKLIKRYGRYI